MPLYLYEIYSSIMFTASENGWTFAISNIVPRFEKFMNKNQEQEWLNWNTLAKFGSQPFDCIVLYKFQASDLFCIEYSNVNLCHPFFSICFIFFTY